MKISTACKTLGLSVSISRAICFHSELIFTMWIYLCWWWDVNLFIKLLQGYFPSWLDLYSINMYITSPCLFLLSFCMLCCFAYILIYKRTFCFFDEIFHIITLISVSQIHYSFYYILIDLKYDSHHRDVLG